LDKKQVDVSKIGEKFEQVDSKSAVTAVAEIKQLLHETCIIQSESSIWCMEAEVRFDDNIHRTKTKVVRNNLVLFLIVILIQSPHQA